MLFLTQLYLPNSIAIAGPVEWIEVPNSKEGRQWFDLGSLRKNKSGNISILSRFNSMDEGGGISKPSSIFVMEIDCQNKLYRDTSNNGIPLFHPEWKNSNGDSLIDSVMTKSCSAIDS